MIDRFKTKENWLLNNGFQRRCKTKNVTTYEYKGSSWTKEDILNTPISLLIRYKIWQFVFY